MTSGSIADSDMHALHAEGVHVALQGNQILHGVDLAVDPGQVVAVLGGNGSGKSTLMRAVIGAVPTTAGTIRLFGQPATAAARSSLGYVPQRTHAGGGVSATVREVVESGLLGYRRWRPGRGRQQRIARALDTLGIADLAQREVGHLSGGQQQRALIARALVREPRLIVLDEPMAGVDLHSQLAFAHALGHLKEDGAAIVIVLHELGALARHIDTAVVLEQGCVTYAGEPPADLGVHALPGHDHDHPHGDPEPPSARSVKLEDLA